MVRHKFVSNFQLSALMPVQPSSINVLQPFFFSQSNTKTMVLIRVMVSVLPLVPGTYKKEKRLN